jgi:hypothetical protein
MRQRLVVAGRKGNLAATSCAWIVEAGSDNPWPVQHWELCLNSDEQCRSLQIKRRHATRGANGPSHQASPRTDRTAS